ncbi:exported protein (hyp8) [Plasmodium gaboni]|uniref:Exported protein (Hyp8) n=1 Tax=Plasmodium gaboni TaxID=647221 RepID=A0A151LD17_9APIC|nr:exported protein (hyp8) [Plasmodium gaboni]KYN96821.1 exported protein (hyp8) [Plasmodium gaboni]SCQ12864.1 Plasmodium exported protein (hyp8), unknown function [Plasmodium gaboni]SOV24070.1 Plasmodium exported protein (hyp8), unknown function [Plasmodium sp. DRC-Itaito]
MSFCSVRIISIALFMCLFLFLNNVNFKNNFYRKDNNYSSIKITTFRSLSENNSAVPEPCAPTNPESKVSVNTDIKEKKYNYTNLNDEQKKEILQEKMKNFVELYLDKSSTECQRYRLQQHLKNYSSNNEYKKFMNKFVKFLKVHNDLNALKSQLHFNNVRAATIIFIAGFLSIFSILLTIAAVATTTKYTNNMIAVAGVGALGSALSLPGMALLFVPAMLYVLNRKNEITDHYSERIIRQVSNF